MGKFIVKESPIEGLRLITSEKSGEEIDYSSMGLDVEFVSQSVEKLARGVLRGLHFTREEEQARLITVRSGRILAVAVDLRPENRTFGAALSYELNEHNGAMLFVPPYFALGYVTLESGSEVEINYSTEYDPKMESGIIWDDDVLMIEWQFERYEIDKRWLNISQRDKKLPSFRSYNPNLLWPNRPKASRYSKRRNYKEERIRRGYDD
ncbi:MAG: dTDP-4-dehydrorhamnose 3,5-epimerase [Rikenellaceae bacterium]